METKLPFTVITQVILCYLARFCWSKIYCLHDLVISVINANGNKTETILYYYIILHSVLSCRLI